MYQLLVISTTKILLHVSLHLQLMHVYSYIIIYNAKHYFGIVHIMSAPLQKCIGGM